MLLLGKGFLFALYFYRTSIIDGE